ncbi:MAG: SDR family NAD(P)-dependent oxidoreductase [Bacilli bacterium]|nr:SDR family NAD(P)-dependent oxidoreductase [Bacilli bacterium]
MKVQGKNIIVTGAGAGIGRELVFKLLNKGANVIGIDINTVNLEETKKLTKENANFTYFTVDISKDEDLKKFETFYFNKYQNVDILINNAGIIQKFVYVNDLDMNEINKVMNVNFFGLLKLTKMFLPHLLKNKEGHIVNVSSMGGFFPFPGQTIYGASKAAVKIFTEGLYAELLDTNVGVTIVFPGAIKTDIAKNSNVIMESSSTKSNMPMTNPDVAANLIVEAIEKNKFQVYIGTDAKMMNLMYKMNPKKAIKFINKKMKELLKK